MPHYAAVRHLLLGVAAWAALAGLAADTSGAATYYVSIDTGNDANPGSQAQPWRTLQKAGDVAGAGDTVNVLTGTYQGFRPRKSGNAQQPVRFLAQPGVIVTSAGPANSNNDGIWIRNVSYVVVDGFEVTTAPRAGIAIQGEPDGNVVGVVVRNCHCHHNTRWGIFTAFSRDMLLERNETSYSAVEHGIYVSNSGDNPIVRDNHAHHNNASGIQLNADPAQMGDDPNDPEGDGIIVNAVVERNVIHDNGAVGGAAINLASVRASVIRNNLLYANLSTGIAGWDDGFDSAYGTRDNHIIGNTIVQPSNGRFAIGLKDGSINNVVVDNVLLHAGIRGALEVDASSQPGLQSDYNVVTDVLSDDNDFFSLSEWQTQFGFDLHSVVSTPAATFANAAQGDYHLSATSPARDFGITLADLAADLDGGTRPQGPKVDAGAYELVAGAASPTPTRTPVPSSTRTATASATRTASATATRTASVTATRTAPATVTATSAATATATSLPIGALHIAGALQYYRGAGPVAAAGIYLDGAASPAASSGADGTYDVSGVTAAAHTVEPRKHGGRFNGVSALDAAYVLQYVADRRSLDAAQRLACDVTASGALSALDATRILQYTVGALPQFAAATACDSDWLFAPRPVAGAQLTVPALGNGLCQRGAISASIGADASGFDFDALLIGDCTGNWQPAAAATAALRQAAAGARAAVRTRRRPDGGLRIVLAVRSRAPFQAVEAALAIAGDVRIAAIRPALNAPRALVQANQSAPGRIAVAMASAAPIERAAIVIDLATTQGPRPSVSVERMLLE